MPDDSLESVSLMSLNMVYGTHGEASGGQIAEPGRPVATDGSFSVTDRPSNSNARSWARCDAVVSPTQEAPLASRP